MVILNQKYCIFQQKNASNLSSLFAKVFQQSHQALQAPSSQLMAVLNNSFKEKVSRYNCHGHNLPITTLLLPNYIYQNRYENLSQLADSYNSLPKYRSFARFNILQKVLFIGFKVTLAFVLPLRTHIPQQILQKHLKLVKPYASYNNSGSNTNKQVLLQKNDQLAQHYFIQLSICNVDQSTILYLFKQTVYPNNLQSIISRHSYILHQVIKFVVFTGRLSFQTFYLYFCSYSLLIIGFLSQSTIMKSFKHTLRSQSLVMLQNLLSVTSLKGWLQTQTIMFLISLAEQQSSFSTIIFISYSVSQYQIPLRFLSKSYSLAAGSGLPMQINLENLLLAAGSSYFGRFVAPITIKSPLLGLLIPSIKTKNSVFSLLEAQCYFSLRAVSIESISSIKIMEGAFCAAAANTFFTIFYDYPRYLFMIDEADKEKKVHQDQLAKAEHTKVFPFPGGPQSKRPLGGALIPVQRSGLFPGLITASFNILITSFKPTISLKLTLILRMIKSFTSGYKGTSFGLSFFRSIAVGLGISPP